MAVETSPLSRIDLPLVPDEFKNLPVVAWQEEVSIDTYHPLAPEKLPMFFEDRVYQGSSGRVYPLPFYNRIDHQKKPNNWKAIHLENRFIRIMILPELGGRIHIALDKTNGYDFIYRNNVIKPALVGLAGPWISGGIEFNWPQHHRPATYMPVNFGIEYHEDESVTVWCSDHEPFNRMKGMHGITLRPNSSLIEICTRLNNRTENTQTFLWWTNMAAAVNDKYQSFFPTDVKMVADHARRAVTNFPKASGKYYGIDYKERTTAQDPEANRLDWYKNIPVPTSYMCIDSKGDFLGGYDHGVHAGFVHVADHRVSPGKKQWTWGNSEFGFAWDRNLTDADGPYIELMAGVYTDNQPDFSYLQPGETKTFSQYLYPIHNIGPAAMVTKDLALSIGQVENLSPKLTRTTEFTEFGIESSSEQVLQITVMNSMKKIYWQSTVRFEIGQALIKKIPFPIFETLEILITKDDQIILDYQFQENDRSTKEIKVAVEPASPAQISSVEELYLIGIHLVQYRHATRRPEPYWEEALLRDPGHVGSLLGLADMAYKAGHFEKSTSLLKRSLDRLTALNPNPANCEVFYRLGLSDKAQGNLKQAFDYFAKASWDWSWRSASCLEMARIHCISKEWDLALKMLDDGLRLNADMNSAINLKALILREQGQHVTASVEISKVLKVDPLDIWANYLSATPLEFDARTHLDLVCEYADAGFPIEALHLAELGLAIAKEELWTGLEPLFYYYQAWLLDILNQTESAHEARRQASVSDASYCFPHTRHDDVVLTQALLANKSDPRANSLRGNLLYDRRRYQEAIALWETAVLSDPTDYVSWRNLAVGIFNAYGDASRALDCYSKALRASPCDGRLLYEFDQLAKRIGQTPQLRVARIQDYFQLIETRDDLTIEYLNLLILQGKLKEAQTILLNRNFQPWEGGEGKVLNLWGRVHTLLALKARREGDWSQAKLHLQSTLKPPMTLGESFHPLANKSDYYWYLGEALEALGFQDHAEKCWNIAASFSGDFREMKTQSMSDKSYFSILSLKKLGKVTEAREMTVHLCDFAKVISNSSASIDYFGTSLPRLSLFKEDLNNQNQLLSILIFSQCDLLEGNEDASHVGLESILHRDPSNELAFDLLQELNSKRKELHE
jgi:tetratricopeptide (TPR) repeat protein